MTLTLVAVPSRTLTIQRPAGWSQLRSSTPAPLCLAHATRPLRVALAVGARRIDCCLPPWRSGRPGWWHSGPIALRVQARRGHLVQPHSPSSSCHWGSCGRKSVWPLWASLATTSFQRPHSPPFQAGHALGMQGPQSKTLAD